MTLNCFNEIVYTKPDTQVTRKLAKTVATVTVLFCRHHSNTGSTTALQEGGDTMPHETLEGDLTGSRGWRMSGDMPHGRHRNVQKNPLHQERKVLALSPGSPTPRCVPLSK